MKIIKSARVLSSVEEIVCKSCSAKLKITTMECARPEGFDFFEVECPHCENTRIYSKSEVTQLFWDSIAVYDDLPSVRVNNR